MDTATFIKKSVEVHGSKYDYSLAEYSMDRSLRTTIICPVHKEFQQRPKNHLAGRGCPHCANERNASIKKEKAAAELIGKFKEIHGDRYCYSKTVYNGMGKKLCVTCYDHGDFEITPNNHMYGKGCRDCYLKSKLMTNEEFLCKARSVHGNKYDYARVDIQRSKQKVEILCPAHKSFFQSYLAHCNGDGCPECATTGYKTSIPGKFYVLELDNVTKIGITNRTIDKRVNQIKLNSGKDFSVVTEFKFSDGSIPLKLETNLLRELRTQYSQPSEKYDGSTECFIDVDVQALLLRIRELSKELTT